MPRSIEGLFEERVGAVLRRLQYDA